MPWVISYIFADSFLHWNCIYLILHIDPEVKQVWVIPISITYCQVSEYFFYWLCPYSSDSELSESTVLAIVEREVTSADKGTDCSALIWRSEVRIKYNF